MLFRMLSFLLMTALSLTSYVADAAEKSHPNIVFILADDLGYGDLGCYGATDLRTPHLDKLAAEGVRFTDFYANGAICSPTRAAFLTGRYQQRVGMENALYYQEKGRGLPAEGETIADALKSAGYVTGICGKWHVGYDPVRQPLQQGFRSFLRNAGREPSLFRAHGPGWCARSVAE